MIKKLTIEKEENLKVEFFLKIEEILKEFFNIKGGVLKVNRCVILANGEIVFREFDKGFHRDLPRGLSSGFEIILDNGKKVLFLRGRGTIDKLKRIGFKYERYIIIDDDNILALPLYKQEEFYLKFYEVSDLEKRITFQPIKERLVKILNSWNEG